MTDVEVIVTTYNNPTALHFALLGLHGQTLQAFRICVADDGSGEETRKVVGGWAQRFGQDRFRHVWHPDNGFEKNKILNKAIHSSSASYLIFIDGDCIAHPDFLLNHTRDARQNRFLSGGVIRLPGKISPLITENLIISKEIFSQSWLFENGVEKSLSNYMKSSVDNYFASRCLNSISPVKKTWNGGNASTWRNHIIKVNGFDESLKYGAEDIELGYRLNNIGVFGRHVRYSALLLHIDHERGYVDRDLATSNKSYAEYVLKNKIQRTKNGIMK